MRSHTHHLYLPVLLALLLPVLPVHATVIPYSDSTSFNAEAAGLTSTGFARQSPVNMIKDYNTSTGYQIGGVDLLDHVQSGDQTPDPRASLLIGGGLVSVGFFRRRLRALNLL